MQSSEDPHTYSVVVPVHGSEGMLTELYERLTSVMSALVGNEGFYELIFVDDVGPGRTWSILKDLAAGDSHVRAIQLMKNSGQALATICGLQMVSGSRVITLDDDLQHPPEEIPILVDFLDEHPECDVVMGISLTRQHSPLRRLGSRMVNRMNTVFLDKPADLSFSSFRVMSGLVARSFSSVQLPYPAIGPLLLRVTSRIQNVVVEHHPRRVGRSGYGPRKLFRQTVGNLVAFSMLPLQALAAIGILGIFLTVGYATYLLVRYVVNGAGVPGFTTQALLLTSMFGVSFFAFGVIGEYLIRILNSTATTPPYVVRADVRLVTPSSDSWQSEETGVLTDSSREGIDWQEVETAEGRLQGRRGQDRNDEE